VITVSLEGSNGGKKGSSQRPTLGRAGEIYIVIIQLCYMYSTYGGSTQVNSVLTIPYVSPYLVLPYVLISGVMVSPVSPVSPLACPPLAWGGKDGH
jgi:hypothetical protein